MTDRICLVVRGLQVYRPDSLGRSHCLVGGRAVSFHIRPQPFFECDLALAVGVFHAPTDLTRAVDGAHRDSCH